MGKKDSGISRRDFMRGAAAAGAVFGGFTILGATARGQGKALKVGLIGCGGRGRGALAQHVDAAKVLNDKLNLGIDLQVVATADWFKDRAEQCGTDKRYGVPKDRCFGGPLAYQQLIDSGVDIVLMATAPNFRPVHCLAAAKAGKHVFMEKPVGVDPPGCRMVIEAGEAAKKNGTMIVAGTQRRHERGYIDSAQACLVEGKMGKLLAGRVSWCMGWIGWSSREPIRPKTPSDLVRTWPNWVALCGDHICEQHVHNLDVANWRAGRPPQTCVGFGASHRRTAGDMWDSFSLDLDYGDGLHIHSMCRQISGCWDWVGEEFIYEKGRTSGDSGPKPDQSPIPADLPQHGGGHQQEHINLLYRIAKGLEPYNEARSVAHATAVAVMGRISAYTGRMVRWDEMMEDPKKRPEVYNLTLKPTAKDFETDSVELPTKEMPDRSAIAIPGKA